MGTNVMDTSLVAALNHVNEMVSKAVRIVEETNREQNSQAKKKAAISIVEGFIILAGLYLGLSPDIIKSVNDAIPMLIDSAVALYNFLNIFTKSGKK